MTDFFMHLLDRSLSFYVQWGIHLHSVGLHHSMNEVYHNKNFASLFQFLDILFCIAVHPSRTEVLAIHLGDEGDAGQAPPLGYLCRICVASWRRLLGSLHA